MSDEYLWDRSGEPDAEIVRLENALSALRYREPPRKSAGRHWWWAVAAAAVLLIGMSWTMLRSPAEKTSWQAVQRVEGRDDGAPRDVYRGQKIATDAGSRMQIRSEFVGQVELEPNSELVVKESREGRQLLSLRRGTLHALIWAPPSHFAVDTPSVRAIDLGCAYTLETQSNGDGLITVQTGWVAFDRDRTESFIPAGAACRTRARGGPGIPWFADASSELKAALERYEQKPGREALRSVLAASQAQDGLTLWHLLTRVQGTEREEVYDRFARLVKAPVEKSAVLAGDRGALDQCWDALELGQTSWWRTWKRSW